jgi:Brp/Blh family beta-carotene 15,15'-monooxygenase
MASVALIGVIGLPHGAIDHILYEQGSADGKRHRVLFIIMYMVVMGIMAAFIHFQPVLGMAFFLMASSYHWGMSHGSSQSPRLAFLGAAIIHQLQVRHAGDVLYVCKLLAPGQPESVAGVFDVIGYAGCAVFAIMALEALIGKGSDASTRKSVMKETLMLLAVAYLSAQNSLLWSFAVYFSLGHSIEAWHEQFSMRQSFTDEFSEYYSTAIPYSVAFVVGFALVAWASTYFPQGPPIAMAALLAGPLPHVMFQELAMPQPGGKSMSLFGWSSPQGRR